MSATYGWRPIIPAKREPISTGTAYLVARFFDCSPGELNQHSMKPTAQAIWFLRGIQVSHLLPVEDTGDDVAGEVGEMIEALEQGHTIAFVVDR